MNWLQCLLVSDRFRLSSAMERMNFHSQALEGVDFDCIMGIIYFMSTHCQSIVITAPLEGNISFQTRKTEMDLLCCCIWSHQACTLPYIRDRLLSKWEFMASVSSSRTEISERSYIPCLSHVCSQTGGISSLWVRIINIYQRSTVNMSTVLATVFIKYREVQLLLYPMWSRVLIAHSFSLLCLLYLFILTKNIK